VGSIFSVKLSAKPKECHKTFSFEFADEHSGGGTSKRILFGYGRIGNKTSSTGIFLNDLLLTQFIISNFKCLP